MFDQNEDAMRSSNATEYHFPRAGVKRRQDLSDGSFTNPFSITMKAPEVIQRLSFVESEVLEQSCLLPKLPLSSIWSGAV